MDELLETLETVREACKNATVEMYKDTDFETIATKMNPALATCAKIVDDPVQTDAMTKFAEGKLSYAEMRMLCG